MSFLAGRLAGKEAAFFYEQSKQAVTHLAEKLPKTTTTTTTTTSCAATSTADVLPEVLRHSLPANVFRQDKLSDPEFSLSKWAVKGGSSSGGGVSADVLNPLRGYVSLPQVTLGPKRWQLPESQSSVTASTANELRRDQLTEVNPEKLRAAAEGLAQIGKAFAVATAIIFGSAALTIGLAASKLDLHNGDDIRTKGRDLAQPRLESIKGHLSPLRDWAETTSKKWHIKNEQEIKERPIVKELSKILGTKNSA